MEKLGITEMPELRSEQWEQMYVSEKVEVLQECERRISEHEGRATVDVLSVNMAELSQTHEQCRSCDAVLIAKEDGQEIVLDDRFLSDATPEQAFEKYTHEAAHAYQMEAMENPGFHPSEYEVAEWKEARAVYDSQGSNQEYQNNALEVDARYFAESCSHELEQSHAMQRAQEELAQELREQPQQQAPKQTQQQQVIEQAPPPPALESQERER